MSETILDRVAAQVSSALARHGISQTGTIEREIALAAIFGMREASPDMIDAGRDVGADAPYGLAETREKWSVMIEAALIESDRAFDDHKAKIQAKD
ncbi:hypothetical protein ATE67_13900 [Sphingopyxis sp. H050]|jgi:hypothetical protein|uniref:hypothetical protein n=1 Tax=Sphingopyxis sp. H050 TaxID=1759072 RepID=UPI000736727E|nr:hypothetical protein [Sphingopyxis sp. H050]KTE19733.1 hypothetical protein ATE67_13900 [Sphingopyxis sp. H050]